MVVEDIEQCNCSLWLPEDNTVRFCSSHHSYRRGAKKLVSVTSVIRFMWPLKPDFSKAPPEVVENARDRGNVTDYLFSSYVNGTLDRIPRGTRQDAVELFFKVRRWFDSRKHENAKAQVILADQDIAGTCDLLTDDYIYDLKATHDVEPVYPIQLAAYAQLHFATFQKPVKGIGIIHVTKRFAEPRIIKLDLTSTLQDWVTLREMWNLVCRRAPARGAV